MAAVSIEPHERVARDGIDDAGENHLAVRLKRWRRRGHREALKLAREIESAVEAPVRIEPRLAEMNLAVWLEDEAFAGLGGVKAHIHTAVGIEPRQSKAADAI